MATTLPQNILPSRYVRGGVVVATNHIGIVASWLEDCTVGLWTIDPSLLVNPGGPSLYYIRFANRADMVMFASVFTSEIQRSREAVE